MKKFMIVILLVFPILSSADWWITTVDSNGCGGTSIGLDSLGYPHIAYMCWSKSPLRYASWNPDSTWTTEVIDGGIGTPCFRFDSKWHSHIARSYQRYGYKDSTGWHIETISFPDPLIYGWDEGRISMDLDSKDFPHVLGSNSVFAPPEGTLSFLER